MSTVTLAFDRFGCDCIAAEQLCSTDVLRAAARHYLKELGSGRIAARVPSFARRTLTSPALEVGVEIDGDDLAALSEEADRQGVAIEQLLVHAAMLYVAEKNSGREGLTLVQ